MLVGAAGATSGSGVPGGTTVTDVDGSPVAGAAGAVVGAAGCSVVGGPGGSAVGAAAAGGAVGPGGPAFGAAVAGAPGVTSLRDGGGAVGSGSPIGFVLGEVVLNGAPPVCARAPEARPRVSTPARDQNTTVLIPPSPSS
jgi:hypothetical protein